MTEKPLVSVIIPIYKVEPYLCECVDSVINQTYKNLEIILVDDGSPDKCPEICDEYVLKDSRIRVVHKPNGGLSDARNTGIEIAKGEYLSFVDSDDLIHSQMIEVLMKPLIEDKGLKMSACQFLDFDDGKEFNKDQEIKPVEIIDFREYFTKKIWAIACAKVYETSLFENIKYPVGRYHEDEFTTYKVCDLAYCMAYTESQMYFYRQRYGSIMHNYNLKKVIDTHGAFKEQIDYFLSKNKTVFYSKTILTFAQVFIKCKLITPQIEGCQNVLDTWRAELKKYPKHYLSLAQKINYIAIIHFPQLRNFVKKILSKN
jgi:glycosyltransferase involved in cell wall biosynthesis